MSIIRKVGLVWICLCGCAHRLMDFLMVVCGTGSGFYFESIKEAA